jgi:hypothetical protein
MCGWMDGLFEAFLGARLSAAPDRARHAVFRAPARGRHTAALSCGRGTHTLTVVDREGAEDRVKFAVSLRESSP